MRNSVRIRAAVCLVLLGTAGLAIADPLQQTVEYRVHELPDDPNSPVVFVVRVALQSADANMIALGWAINTITFEELDEFGEITRTWIDADPNLPTPDGLWWIEHADLADPLPGEFNEPPLLLGTAAAQDVGENDLQYGLDGVAALAPPEGHPYMFTATLDHVFKVLGETEAIVEGVAESVEIPPGEDDPGNG